MSHRPIGLLLALAAVVTSRPTTAAEPTVAALAPETAVEKLGPEARAARQLAKKLASAALVLPAGDGEFVDAQGKPATLAQFRAVWLHQGDTAAQDGPLYRPKTVRALRGYVEGGGGLYLSGAALAMVHTLGIEPVRPRLGRGGRDRYEARLVAVEKEHPVFAGLAFEGIFEGGTIVPLTSGGWPAYADFLGSGGPTRGMLLARADCAAENPLAEYELGRGRVIVLGWRAANYALADNAHRDNLERLTGNILAYLGDRRRWQKVVIGPVHVPQSVRLGVAEHDWRALELAVEDLAETFKGRYPEGGEFLGRLKALRQAHDAILGKPAGGDAGGTEKGDKSNLPRSGPEGASHKLDLSPFSVPVSLDGDALKKLDEIARQFEALKREALLANPLLDFDRLLLVKRGVKRLGLPANWQSNSSLPRTGYDNQIATLSPVRPDGEKGSGAFCAKHPPGRSGKRLPTPFPAPFPGAPPPRPARPRSRASA